MITAPPPGSGITASQANAVADALDAALSALFCGRSPLLWLPIGGSSSWFESRLGGLLYNFGGGTKRLLTGTFAPAVHDQSVYDAMAASAVLGDADHALKQVTAISHSGGAFAPNDFDRSLKVHRKTFTDGSGTHENYYLRINSWSVATRQYYNHEHRHELAVIDLAFEGHAGSFTFPATWDKFACVRIHNLDATEDPLVVTFEGDPDLVVEVPRWGCKSIRRDGETWEEQGFLLFRTRASDMTRFGGTLPWNDPDVATPWLTLKDAVIANNVASLGSVHRWMEYFRSGGGGVQEVYAPRTGLHYDPTVVTGASVPGLANPNDTETLLHRLVWHGGKFLLARKLPDPEEPDPPELPEIVEHTATLDELLAGTHPSRVRLEIVDGEDLQIRYQPDATTFAYVDFIPLDCNFTGPVSLPPDGTPVVLVTGHVLPTPYFRRLVPTTVSETAGNYGGGDPETREYTSLVLEEKPATASPGFETTVADVRAWSFGDLTEDNDYCTFAGQQTTWDGRRFLAHASLQFAPTGGASIADPAALTGVSVDPGNPSFLLPGQPIRIAGGTLTWPQASAVQTYPGGSGGVWFLPSEPVRAWQPVLDDAHHPHLLGVLGRADGGDWTAKPTMEAPRSRIRRMGQLPLGGLYGTTGYTATDSRVFLSENLPSPEYYATHRDDILAGNELLGEKRHVLASGLHAIHFRGLVDRLNAIREVFPFSFLDAIWYGRPFRPPASRTGIYGGHIHPGDFLTTTPPDSLARTRATSLGIPIRVLATTHPIFAELAEYPVQANTGSTTYTAFDEFNLLNDILPWFRPDGTYVDAAAIVSGGPPDDPGTGYFWGEEARPTGFGNWWRGAAPGNADAVVPDYDYVRATDVRDAAASLGIPFRLERFGLPLKIKVILPVRNAPGVRTYPPPPSFLAVRTEARMVIDDSESPQFIAWAGQLGTSTLFWARTLTARLANWPRYPGTLGTDDEEAAQIISSLVTGYDRGGGAWSIPLSRVTLPSLAASQPFPAEAPRLYLQKLVSGDQGASRLLALPVPAIQWGPESLVNAGPPGVGELGLYPLLSELPTVLTPGTFAAAGWDGYGGWQVCILPVGIMLAGDEEDEP